MVIRIQRVETKYYEDDEAVFCNKCKNCKCLKSYIKEFFLYPRLILQQKELSDLDVEIITYWRHFIKNFDSTQRIVYYHYLNGVPKSTTATILNNDIMDVIAILNKAVNDFVEQYSCHEIGQEEKNVTLKILNLVNIGARKEDLLELFPEESMLIANL